jgi:hypothetical protein
MDIDINKWPLIFQRDEFSFRVLKQQSTTSQITQIKQDYQTVWQQWKACNLEVASHLDLGKPKIESWTNGWKIRDHFWACYRLKNNNACLAVLVNEKQIQVYLMFQRYRQETREGTHEAYVMSLKTKVPNWSHEVNVDDFVVSDNLEVGERQELSSWLKSPIVPMDQVGKVWTFPLILNFSEFEREWVKTLSELAILYRAII